MTDDNGAVPGKIEWCDLTVDDADSLRDFYGEVVGWEPSGVSMGDYFDYSMNLPGTDTAVAGVCHARGSNANIPPQWLIYVRVDDADAAAQRCRGRGGTVVDGPRDMDGMRFCVIQDPAGAVMALLSGG